MIPDPLNGEPFLHVSAPKGSQCATARPPPPHLAQEAGSFVCTSAWAAAWMGTAAWVTPQPIRSSQQSLACMATGPAACTVLRIAFNPSECHPSELPACRWHHDLFCRCPTRRLAARGGAVLLAHTVMHANHGGFSLPPTPAALCPHSAGARHAAVRGAAVCWLAPSCMPTTVVAFPPPLFLVLQVPDTQLYEVERTGMHADHDGYPLPPMLQVPDTQLYEVEPFVASMRSTPKSGMHNPFKNPERCAHAGCPSAHAVARLPLARLRLCCVWSPSAPQEPHAQPL